MEGGGQGHQACHKVEAWVGGVGEARHQGCRFVGVRSSFPFLPLLRAAEIFFSLHRLYSPPHLSPPVSFASFFLFFKQTIVFCSHIWLITRQMFSFYCFFFFKWTIVFCSHIWLITRQMFYFFCSFNKNPLSPNMILFELSINT